MNPRQAEIERNTLETQIRVTLNLDGSGTAGKVHHHPRQRLVKGHVGMAIALDAGLVPHGAGKGLTEGDADILYRVVGVNVQITLGLNAHVEKAMTDDLVDHVVEKG